MDTDKEKTNQVDERPWKSEDRRQGKKRRWTEAEKRNPELKRTKTSAEAESSAHAQTAQEVPICPEEPICPSARSPSPMRTTPWGSALSSPGSYSLQRSPVEEHCPTWDRLRSAPPSRSPTPPTYDLPLWARNISRYVAPGVERSALDAQVAWLEPGGKYVVTSPNMDFVPEPVWGIVTLTNREDGSFGVHDPIHWPQLFVPERSMAYFAAMPRGPWVAQDDVMFTTMTSEHFLVTESVLEMPLGIVSLAFRHEMADALGLLEADVKAARAQKDLDTTDLFWLWTTVAIACDLLTYPATFRDMVKCVGHVQRLYRSMRAWLVWFTELSRVEACGQHVRRDLMGAFTTDAAVAIDLAMRGCPVWHFRQSHSFTQLSCVERWVDVTPPLQVPSTYRPFSGGDMWRGLAGRAHLRFILENSFKYVDIEVTPMPASWHPVDDELTTPKKIEDGQSLKGRKSRVTPGQRSGRSKFVDFEHKWMPAPLPTWIEGLGTVDSSATGVLSSDVWGYWFPEAALVIASNDVARVEKSLFHWLAIREPWLSLQRDWRTTFADRTAPAAAWRIMLIEGPMAEADEERMAVKQAEGKELSAQERNRLRWMKMFRQRFDIVGVRKEKPPLWFGRELPQLKLDSDNAEADVPLKQVVWELHELGFRAELLELDQRLVPAQPGRSGVRFSRDLQITHLFDKSNMFSARYIPETPVGFAAVQPQARAESLEGLRAIMVDWPDVPPKLRQVGKISRDLAEEVIVDVEKTMTSFYCQTFYRVSGRAPVVPRRPPPRSLAGV